jgi:hypothetical protein
LFNVQLEGITSSDCIPIPPKPSVAVGLLRSLVQSKKFMAQGEWQGGCQGVADSVANVGCSQSVDQWSASTQNKIINKQIYMSCNQTI